MRRGRRVASVQDMASVPICSVVNPLPPLLCLREIFT